MSGGGLTSVSNHSFLLGPLGRDSVVLDLGAAGADFAIEVGRRTGCLCHVFEPSAVTHAAIPQTPRLVAHRLAVAGADGMVRFGLTEGQEFDWGTIAPLGDLAYRDAIEVEAVSLDTLVARLGLDRVDLIKVDIEGAELAMFEAASDRVLTLAPQIAVEFHDFMDPAMGPAVERIKARMRRLGYDVVVFTRHFHGDVLFLDRRRLGLTAVDMTMLRAAKYARGLARMLRRLI